VQVALRIWVHVTPRIFRTGSETDPASGAGEAGVDPEGGCAWADARRPGVGDIALESLSLGGNCPLVAFIDILGFGREIEAAKSEEDFQRIYKKLHFVQEAFQNSSVAKDPADQTRLNLDYGRKVLALSDTVVLAITANCPAEKTGRNRHHTHPAPESRRTCSTAVGVAVGRTLRDRGTDGFQDVPRLLAGQGMGAA